MKDSSGRLNVHISFKSMESSDAVKDYASKKVEKIAKHIDHVMTCHFVFHKEKNTYVAELHTTAKGFDAKARAEDDDSNLYAAIDDVTDKLEQQARKHKEKHQGY